jgi:uncharacterized protein YndB with AHSA1/START domain
MHMPQNLVAKASITVNAPAARVWKALVDPAIIKQYMFGATVSSDFRKGRPITWKGEWQGKPYEDKGTILEVQRNRVLAYSHFSPLSGQPDVPENYHTVRIELDERGGETLVTLTQDRNATEQEREHSEKNWRMMLEGLKKSVDGRGGQD